MSQDWNQTLQSTFKYQVWILGYPLDSDSVGNDRGYQLVGQCDTIAEAAQYAIKHSDYTPMITKTVTYRTDFVDVTELEEI